jgi:hypothetical protein
VSELSGTPLEGLFTVTKARAETAAAAAAAQIAAAGRLSEQSSAAGGAAAAAARFKGVSFVQASQQWKATFWKAEGGSRVKQVCSPA